MARLASPSMPLHIRLANHPVRDIHHNVTLRRQVAEEGACGDILVESLPGAAVEVDHANSRPLRAVSRLPEVT